MRTKAEPIQSQNSILILHPLPLIDPLLADVLLCLSICLYDSKTDFVPSLLLSGHAKKIQMKAIYFLLLLLLLLLIFF